MGTVGTVTAPPSAAGPGYVSGLSRSAAGLRLLRGPAALLCVIVVWEMAARTVLDGSYAVAPPTEVAGRIFDEWHLYRSNLRTTLSAAGWGFLWGNLAAVALAVVAAEVRVLDRLVHRIALTVFCLPLVAIAPILRVIYGQGAGPQITLAALAVFFTTLVSTVLGLRSAPGALLDVAHVYGAGRMSVLVRIQARAALPSLVAGLQIAAPAAFLGAIVGEFSGASRGFGILLIQALRTLETSRVWAVATVCAAVATIAYRLVGLAGRALCRWAPEVSVTAGPRRPRRTGIAAIGERAVGAAVAGAVVLALWVGALSWFGLDPYFAKGPGDVWDYLVGGEGAAARRDEMLGAMWSTLGTAGLGFVAGTMLAVGLAVLFVVKPLAETALMPVAIAMRSIPIIATVPLLILVFGRGVLGTVAVVAVMVFFPTLVNVGVGMRDAPLSVIDVLHVYDAGWFTMIRTARLPSALPGLFASARIAVPASILAATVAEWLATGDGMGNLMTVASATARYDTLWAAVAVLTLAAVIVYGAIGAIETLVLSRVAPGQVA